MARIDKHWAFRSWGESVKVDGYVDVYHQLKNIKPTKRLSKTQLAKFLDKNPKFKELTDIIDEHNVRLFLDYNHYKEIPEILLTTIAPNVTYLDINYNEMRQLHFLQYFPNLRTLICDHNPITTYIWIPPMPTLTTVWFNHCQIDDLFCFIGRLSEACPNVEYLSLMGNPCKNDYFKAKRAAYLVIRMYAIAMFPNLQLVDDYPVYEEDRNKYKSLEKSLHVMPIRMGFWQRVAALFTSLFSRVTAE